MREAYSLAMIFREVIAELPAASRGSVQIFASDLSADAITAARKGCYPRTIAADMDQARLAKFFSTQGDGYLIDKQIREMVLFAQHDVILDPPFTRLDLLSCRNLLIYFNATLQRRLMPLFSYSLRPGGALLLGSSESLGIVQAQYTPISQKSRLYWRNENSALNGTVDFPSSPFARSRARLRQGVEQVSQPAIRQPARQPANPGRAGAAAGVLAAGRAGQRTGRCRVHQRQRRQIPGAGLRQGQLECPCDGHARPYARRSSSGMRQALQAKGHRPCELRGSAVGR